MNLTWRNTRRMSGPSHDVNYSRCAENLDLAVKPAPNKYIAREQRQQELFGAVPPLVSRTNKWEKDLITLIRKDLSDGLFVLVASIQSVPVGHDGWALHFRSGFR